ncbi:MFS transporter [Streptomyces chartreusis]|uniref:MFS transporter n=1 Tax=Streptomyces chartreusis TaxID=1969 RepID=UPI001C3F7246|nr:MFS transporter [Streptomyces chartreusis]
MVAIGLFVACNLSGYMLIGFINSYGTKNLGQSSSTMLMVSMVGSVSWGVPTVLAARGSDCVGRRRTYVVGAVVLGAWAFPFFLLLDTADGALMVLAVVGLTVGLRLTSDPQAATYAEMFPAPVRYSGASLAYAVGVVLGGGFAPPVAAWLVGTTGSSLPVSAYMLFSCLRTFLAALALRERSADENDAFVRDMGA